MSIWGHVSGIIRVDGMHSSLDDDNWKAPDKPPVCLGKMTPEYDFSATEGMTEEQQEAYYKERHKLWQEAEDSGIPMGSEGSIRWNWQAYKYGDIQYRGLYIIEGDLRDFESDETFFKWIKDIKAKFDEKNVWIRQLNIQLDIEGQESIFYSLRYDEKIKDEVLVKYQVTEQGMLLYAKD